MHFTLAHKSRIILTSVYIVAGLLLCTFIFLASGYWSVMLMEPTETPSLQYANGSMSSNNDPLLYIPQKVVRVWDERDFLIVLGIPSLDIPIRRWRRHMQRISCWQFPEVSTRHNNYTGAMLVLYLLARHPLNKNILSEVLVEEAEQWHDIVIHPMNEGRTTTNKRNDGKGGWGIEGQIGSSRKTYFWFQFALQQFPRVPYLTKGDDDMFLRVPQYLMDLRRLPRRGIYWGCFVGLMKKIDKRGTRVDIKFILGFCMTLARDVATELVSYKPLKRLASLQYSKELEPEFVLLAMDNEDMMVGRVLKLTGYSIIVVSEGMERFHIDPKLPITNNVVVTHIPKEDQYYLLMKRFLLNATTTKATVIKKSSPLFFFVSPPRDKQQLLQTH